MFHPRLFLTGLVLAMGLVAALPAAAQQPRSAVAAQAALRAADTTTTWLIEMRDGSSFFGRVVAAGDDSVTVAANVGRLTIALADVVNATLVRPENMRDGQYWFPNPNATRLLFAPTGRMLAAGKGYFSDYVLVFPGVAYGITDRVTIGGGMSIVPGLGMDEQLFYLTPKLGLISTPTVNVAVGALALRAGLGSDDIEESDANAGILYTVGTFGGINGSLTGGIGFGYAGGELADSPALMIGGDVRLSRRFGLVSENYYFSGISDEALLSLGARFFGEKLAVDLGLVMPTGESIAIPFVGFVVNF